MAGGREIFRRFGLLMSEPGTIVTGVLRPTLRVTRRFRMMERAGRMLALQLKAGRMPALRLTERKKRTLSCWRMTGGWFGTGIRRRISVFICFR